MNRRLPQTLADYLVIGVSPSLIMLLVGSLVFFLVEVLYQGEYKLRLDFILALFVMGAVCIARISMAEGASYALLFAAPLALVTFIALVSFVQFTGALALLGWFIDICFIALIWWSAHKLTWDCTLIDDAEDASGQGLLQHIGLDGEPSAEAQHKVRLPLWERWFGEKQKRPHAPGVWVVYFSLAALPLFGLGQLFIPAADVSARRYTFWLLLIYVAAGLSLLLTTSFLGLRRYLRQRQLEMPDDIAGAWVSVGGMMIVVLLAFCILLPRPGAEYAVSQLPFEIKSPFKRASQWAFGKDGAKGEGRGSESRVQGIEGKAQGTDSRVGPASGTSAGPPQGSGANGSKSQTGQPQSGQPQSGQPQSGQPQSGQPQSGQPQSGQPQSGQPPNNSGNGPRGYRPTESRPPPSSTNNSQASQRPPEAPQSSPPATRAADSSSSVARILSALAWFFGNVLKLAFYCLLAAVVAYFVWRYRTELLAAFRKFLEELRAWWQRLFGPREQEATPAAAPAKPVYKRFADYANPFTSGLAARFSPAELVRYTFEAVEAWGRDHGCPRGPEQTPHEYAEQLARREATLARDAGVLAELYCRAAYAAGALPAGSNEHLQQVWQTLGSAA